MNEHDEADMPYGREGEPWGDDGAVCTVCRRAFCAGCVDLNGVCRECRARQAKHTPGPWNVGVPGRGRFVVSGGRYRKAVCVMQNTQKEPADHAANLEADANAALIAAAPWHALLLRAVLKGWALKRMPHGNKTTDLICGDVVLADYHSPFFRLGVCEYGQIPACPDAETFERIRKAVEGER